MIVKGGFVHVAFALIKRITIEPIRGKWYFYFPSSDSDIKKSREKPLKKDSNHVPENPELAELFELYSPDHI